MRADYKIGDTLLDRYLIEKKLGSGGMSTVFRCRDLRLDVEVAVKMLQRSYRRNADVVRRFLREAKLQAKLNHPNIVHVSNIEDSPELTIMVMEYMRGMSLSDYVAAKGGIDEEELLSYIIPISEALALAHENDVVHRDFKPSNVFLAEKDRSLVPKLIDFGVARELDNSITTSSTLLGTLPYMSFELIKSARNASPASDVYAIGVTLYQLLSGRFPVEADNLKDYVYALMGLDEVPPLSAVIPEVSSALDHVVSSCLRKDATLRYQNGAELVQALRSLPSNRKMVQINRGERANEPLPTTAEIPPELSLAEAAEQALVEKLQERYESLQLIGHGPIGLSFELTDPSGQRFTAKVLAPALRETHALTFKSLTLQQEELCEQSPFVRPHLDFLDQELALLYARPEGDTLDNTLQRYGKLDPAYSVELFVLIVDALRLAHDEELLHGHIHPGNIFLQRRPDGVITPQVFDFAHLTSFPLTDEVGLNQSALFIAPEHVEELDASVPGDVFSLGMCLFATVTGKLPLSCPDRASWRQECGHCEQLPNAAELDPDLPEGLCQVIAWCLSMAPELRYQEMGTLHRDLLAVRKQLAGY